MDAEAVAQKISSCDHYRILFLKEQGMYSESRRETQAAREIIGVNWANGVFLIVAHVGAVAALFFWSWAAVLTAVILYWVAGSLGIGMGYHRLLTHRGYKV